MGSRFRPLIACLATAVVVVPIAWFWQASLVPGTYSVMDMGYLDFGGGSREPVVGAHDHPHGRAGAGVQAQLAAGGRAVSESHSHKDARSVADLVADPDRPADVRVEIVAREEPIELGGGRVVDGYTLNGSSPGPAVEATEGDLVEVEFRNESVPGGATLHWHGVDVPNAADGVAGVTQDAVAPGESHTYRFVVDQAGTYWYHSHQVSHEQVRRGLFGTLVVRPAEPAPDVLDFTAVTHTYDGLRTVNGSEGEVRVEAPAGQEVRLRLVNTDNAPVDVAAGCPVTVAAVDATDLNGPTPVSGQSITLTAGGRVDLLLTVPEEGARVQVGGSSAVVIGPSGAAPPEVPHPVREVDFLSYGEPGDLGLDPESADRHFEYVIGRRPGFLDGRPGLWWTVNGHMFPNIPMFVVTEGDTVVMRLENTSNEVHPMHLHGHHAVVLSRNGEPATGSPWWVDSLDVDEGESYEIAFVADNPGVWMDHCHNLPHAADGLLAHLMYADVHTPYVVGGPADNEPE
jgi:FtsP/CotA-like multicopper oxidase with cupredoxin domain